MGLFALPLTWRNIREKVEIGNKTTNEEWTEVILSWGQKGISFFRLLYCSHGFLSQKTHFGERINGTRTPFYPRKWKWNLIHSVTATGRAIWITLALASLQLYFDFMITCDGWMDDDWKCAYRDHKKQKAFLNHLSSIFHL